MGRTCFVCNSVHRAEYDKMRLEGKPIIDIFYKARNDFKEDNLRYHHFQKHFASHVETLVDEGIKASKLRDEYVKKMIKTDMEVIERLHRNLSIVSDKIDEKLEGATNPVEDEMLLKFIGEARMIIEQYLKWGSRMNIADTSEEIDRKVMKCLVDFPPDLIEKFIERWKAFGSNS